MFMARYWLVVGLALPFGFVLGVLVFAVLGAWGDVATVGPGTLVLLGAFAGLVGTLAALAAVLGAIGLVRLADPGLKRGARARVSFAAAGAGAGVLVVGLLAGVFAGVAGTSGVGLVPLVAVAALGAAGIAAAATGVAEAQHRRTIVALNSTE